jgi:hypothetical protein
LFALAGCAIKTRYEESHAPPRPMMAKPVERVDVLTIPPSRAYVEVGTVTMYQSGPGDGDAEVTAALRREAAQRGCDAIVLRSRDSGQGSAMVDAGACLLYVAAPASR